MEFTDLISKRKTKWHRSTAGGSSPQPVVYGCMA
jgi:hypothetical protein